MGKSMKTVQVLMSTYNGARYLPWQLRSILLQKGVKISLLIRDDGSKDGTLEILEAFKKRYRGVTVYMGCRRGAAGSFYDLLQHADLHADYYAFADQDDIWKKDKLFQAVLLLEEQPQSLPVLYAGKVAYASENLSICRKFPYHIRRRPSFGNALMENICMGCTEVFNRSLLQLVKERLPSDRIMHDWWMYLTAAYFGKVIYDQHVYMLYRQHGDNAIGMQDRWSRRWLHRMRHIRQMKHKLSIQAEAFKNAYEDLLQPAGSCYLPDGRKESPCCMCGNKVSLHLLCGYKQNFVKRCRLVLDKNIYRQNFLDDAVCRLLFMIGFL